MKDYLNEKVLITCSAWFYAPDGKLYRAIWGTLKAVHEAKAVFGFIPTRGNANWMVEIGDCMVMGCQVNYCLKCPTKPEFSTVPHTMYDQAHGLSSVDRPNEIYITV